MLTESKHGHYKISLALFLFACVGGGGAGWVFMVARAKKTEQDHHNNEHNELQSERSEVECDGCAVAVV